MTLLILLFRAGPRDFPYAPGLTRATAALAGAVAYLQYRYTLPPLQAGVQAVVAVAALMGFTAALLRMRGYASRFHQTCGPLLATGAVLTGLALPALASLAPLLLQAAQDPEAARNLRLPGLPAAAVMILWFWNLAVMAHVLRQALEIGAGFAVGLALSVSFLMFFAAGGVAALFGM